jgi:hypothetical protein
MAQEEQGLGGAANMPPFGRGAMGEAEDDYENDGDFDAGDLDEGFDEPRGRTAYTGPRERISQGLLEAADRLELAAERLADFTDEHLADATGPLARAGAVAEGMTERMVAVADYLRTNDVDDMRRGMARQVREKPLHSILIAVAAGWLAGKIIR